MADGDPVTKVSDVIAAVAFALGEQAGDIKGYAVIGIRDDDSYSVTANLPNTLYMLSLLSDVITTTLEGIASGREPILLA